MKAIECAFESDVVFAVQTGRWPNRVEEDLRQHVRTCEVCADAALIAQAMADAAEIDDETAAEELRLPGSGAVWLRSEMRARAEAARTATRPITVVQVVAATSIAATAGALFGATSGWFQSWIGRAWASIVAIDFSAQPVAPSLVASLSEHIVLFGILAAFVLMAPVAVYFAESKESKES